MSKKRPWEAGPFEPWVSDELNYRVDHLSKGISSYPNTDLSKGISSYPNTGDKVSYSGPKKAWARVFSNGMNFSGNPPDSENEWGLVLKSGNGFFERYGVSNNETKQVYGYSNRETPKYVNSQTRINIPDPGITSIETEIQKNFFAKVTINWVCHSIDQLKAIAPYFTTPLTTVIVEFGWNTFDPQSLIPINNYDTIFKIWSNYYKDYSERLSKSKGNYDYIFGQITNFEYSIEDNIIKGKTEVYSRQTFYNGFVSNGSEGIVDVGVEKTKALRESYTKYFTDVILQVIKPGDELKNLLSPVKKTPPNKLDSLNKLDALQLKSISEATGVSVGQLQVKNTFSYNDYFKNGKDLKMLQSVPNSTNPDSKYGENLENLNHYVFTGRNPADISTKVNERDFDKNLDINKNTWITMELLVDILNQIKNIGDNELLKFYYEMDIDDIIIGAHPNLISTTRAVLIPNPYAPKLNSRFYWIINNQTVDTDLVNRTEIMRQSFDENSPTGSVAENTKIGANYTLSSYVASKNIQRENLDYVLNENNRPKKSQTRKYTFFNFKEDGVEKGWGWLKNLYINLEAVINIVKNPNNTTLREIYDEILKLINGSTVNFWDLQVSDVPDTKPGPDKLKIIDHKGPFNTSDDKVFNFEYMTNKSIIKKLNFTTTLSNAQANQVLFRASGKEYESSNNLLDFTSNDQFQDRILKNLSKKTKENKSAAVLRRIPYFKKFAQDGNKTQDGFLQITTFKGKSESITVGNQGGGSTLNINQSDYNIVDLVIPYPEILTFLLNDGDLQNNINIYNSPLRNIHVELSLMGIAGIKTFEIFKILNLPPPYTSDQVVFQVENVTHTINEDTWETRIKANLRPARSLLNKPINKT